MCRPSRMAAVGTFVLAAAVGCGAASTPQTPAKPESARAEHKAASFSPAPLRKVVLTRPPEQEASSQAKVTPEIAATHQAPEPERSPTAVLKSLIAPGLAFMVDYSLTEAFRAAAETCAYEHGEDEAKINDCRQRARESFTADVIRFMEDDDGQLRWAIYRRAGDDLVETHSSKIEFIDIGPSSLTMSILDARKGGRPLFKGESRVVIGMPNEYSIEIRDPEYGRLVYDAKVGLVGR
jgi:hypothetical protein